MQKNAPEDGYAIRVGTCIEKHDYLIKFLRVMRIITFFMMAFCVHVSATGLSQTVTLRGENLSIKEVFSTIERQTDYVVLYTEESVNVRGRFHVAAQDMPLLQFLETVLAGQALDYEIKNKTIIIVPSPTFMGSARSGAPESGNKRRPEHSNTLLQQPVTGTIADASGKPLSGATITVKGTNRKALSDNRGRFSVLASSGETLVFTSVGFTSREIPVEAATQLGVIGLEASTSDLDEVNVVAYGETTRRETTGSVSVVKGADLAGVPSSNLANLLQGRVAGMDITNISGSPGGGGMSITIRGYNSLDVEQGRRFSNPLWVVDGVPLNSFTSPVTGTNMLADINPDMIESIQILKDASSASLYGSRAANGVIIVTTKKGQQNQKAQFSANVSQTYSVLPQLPTVTIGNAERQLRMQAFRNYPQAYLDLNDMRYKYPTSLLESYLNPTGQYDYFFDANPSTDNGMYFQDSLNTFYNNATNFFPMYYETGKVTNANVQTYGGSQNMTYGIGLGYYQEDGVLKGSGFERIDLNSNMNVQPVQKFNVDLRFNASLTNRKRGEKAAPYLGMPSPIIETVPGDPYELSSLYPGEGSVVWSDILEKLSGTQEKNRSVRLRSNFKLSYDILSGLVASSSLAADYAVHRRNYFQPSYLNESGYSRSVGETGVDLMVLNENLLSWKKTINDHHNFNIVAGFSYQYDQVEYNGGHGENSPSDKIYYVRPGFPTLGERTYDYGWGSFTEMVAFQNYLSDMQEKALLSYFSRFEYNYKRKYLLAASFRRDGSSVFGANNKWGTFPSIAAGWSFSEERVVKENVPWLSFGKFRASWGKSGMHFAQNYLALGIMRSGQWPYQGGGVLVPETGEGLYNNNLTWEETDQYDFGVDLDLFDHRLTITSDYYYRYTDRMLMPIRLPGTYNGYWAQWRNAAAVSNEGVELLVNYEVIRKPSLFWKVTVNGARNWNRFEKSYNLKDVTAEQALTNSRWIIGQPLNGIYGFRTQGYVNYQDDLPIYYNAAGISSYYGRYPGVYLRPGDYAFVDVNQDGELSYNHDDHVYLGSALPVFTGGIGTEFRWKHVDLNMLFSYQVGRHIINSMPINAIRTDAVSYFIHPLLINLPQTTFWQAPGDDADYAPVQFDANKEIYSSYIDRYAERVNWMRLKTLTLGYNLPERFSRHLGMAQLRFFASGENLLLWTNYSGLDPETVDISTGYDEGKNYPMARRFTFGLTFKF